MLPSGRHAISICLAMAMGAPPLSAAIQDVVHPAYELKTIPMPSFYRTMGLEFMADGRMVLATSQLVPASGNVPPPSTAAKLYLVSGVSGTLADIQVKEIANNWMQLTGVTVVDGRIFVSDRDGHYEILDHENPGDLQANRRKVVAWPDEGTWNVSKWWHQYVFTPIYYQGSFYAPYSGSIRQGGLSDVPATSGKSGAFLKWNMAGVLETVAGGLRSPNGLNIGPKGEMMVTDNQGGWFPSSTFSLIKPGRFYGHRNTTPNFAEGLPYQPPIVWLPHGDVRRSPTQPVCIPSGLHQGDWLMGDAFHPGLVRVDVDTVQGEYQGAVFWFSRGMGEAAINRLAWGPDGALHIGTIEHIGSLPLGGTTPMYKLAPRAGGKAFEMNSVRLLVDGFQIEFSEPVDKATVTNSAVALGQLKYVRKLGYGEGRVDDPLGTLAVTSTAVSEDGLRVHVKVNKVMTDRVVHLKLTGIKSAAGAAPFDNETWYTVNLLSSKTWSPATDIQDRGWRLERNADALRGRITYRPAAEGLDVAVDLQGPYTLSLRSIDGALVRRIEGNGPARHRMVPGRAGLYLLGLNRGDDYRMDKVAF